ncbi:MAG: hypothetical protein KatS3mg058_2960 [Roseiflexus sp.]|nr:MAG: hypothetical protein KatS3mg058_2960 [Roseiflexus sp.]
MNNPSPLTSHASRLAPRVSPLTPRSLDRPRRTRSGTKDVPPRVHRGRGAATPLRATLPRSTLAGVTLLTPLASRLFPRSSRLTPRASSLAPRVSPLTPRSLDRPRRTRSGTKDVPPRVHRGCGAATPLRATLPRSTFNVGRCNAPHASCLAPLPSLLTPLASRLFPRSSRLTPHASFAGSSTKDTKRHEGCSASCSPWTWPPRPYVQPYHVPRSTLAGVMLLTPLASRLFPRSSRLTPHASSLAPRVSPLTPRSLDRPRRTRSGTKDVPPRVHRGRGRRHAPTCNLTTFHVQRWQV